MAGKNARRVCLAILREWEETSTFIDAILDRRVAKADLDARDRAFVQSATLGVIKNLGLLEAWTDSLRKGKLGAEERRLLALGLYQILLMRVPDHAAVNETVGLARGRARPVINAVLRRATRERDGLLAAAEAMPPADRYSIPDHLFDRWADAFGTGEAERIAALANASAPLFVRSNPLIEGGLGDADLEGCGAVPVAGQAGFYRVAELPMGALLAGRCYAQDPSTAAAPGLLEPRPGERVLDACAAPGGKTAILAAAMENRGEIVAVDSSTARAARLRENLGRLGVTNTCVEVADLGEIATAAPTWAAPASFDRILIDVPCSNTGVLRRRADARWRLAPGFAPQMATLQLRLTRAVLPLLKPGGRLVYSTCSIDPEENAGVVAAVLESEPSLGKVAERVLLPGEEHDGAYAAALEGLVAPAGRG